MSIALRFLGAADTVTGSCFALETEPGTLLIDCGMFQGHSIAAERNQGFGDLDLSRLRAVVLTHAHLDHCGRLPRLSRLGWEGPVHCTQPTRDLAKIVLLDAAGVQEEAARRAARRKAAGKRYDEEDLDPIFTSVDALDALDLFERGHRYDAEFSPMEGIHCSFRDAGHILGSAFVEVRVDRPGQEPMRIVFSGDLGNPGRPMQGPAACPAPADVAVVESTYGDRDHRSFAAGVAELRQAIAETIHARGALLIPSFALERTQELLFVLWEFHRDGLLAGIPVYVDSPMAIDATRIYARHSAWFDGESRTALGNGENPFHWPGLTYVRTPDESRALNDVFGPIVIVASSGMCAGGRIMHHLRNRLDRSSTTVVFLGYQANGTLGRRLVDGSRTVNIYGRELDVRARLVTINGFSGHGGQSTLIDWLNATGPASTIVTVHGEQDKIAVLRGRIADRLHRQAIDPNHGQVVSLD